MGSENEDKEVQIPPNSTQKTKKRKFQNEEKETSPKINSHDNVPELKPFFIFKENQYYINKQFARFSILLKTKCDFNEKDHTFILVEPEFIHSISPIVQSLLADDANCPFIPMDFYSETIVRSALFVAKHFYSPSSNVPPSFFYDLFTWIQIAEFSHEFLDYKEAESFFSKNSFSSQYGKEFF